MSRRARRLLAAAGALCALTAALWWNGFFLAVWQDKTAAVDLDGDGEKEEITLRGRRLSVARGGALLWAAEAGWHTQDFLAGDIDGDGAPELLALVWKRGSYGAARPFWETEDERAYSQHIFIYRWQEEALRPLWMSSALRPRVAVWAFAPDGALEITTPEGEYTLWAWRGWGLARVDVPLRRI